MERYKRMALMAICVATALTVMAMMSQSGIAALESSSVEQFFQKAKKQYLQRNMELAAGEIQKAASFMKAESEKASDKGREALTVSSEELGKLAADVKSGTVKSKKRLEEAFARAHLALASEAHIRATESWAQKESARTGTFLDTAAIHLERSFSWAGRKAEAGTQRVMKKTKELALKLKAKGSFGADEVGKGIQEAGDEIEKFGKRVSP